MTKILIVEDEAHLATGLQFNLQEDGHSAEIASDGELALERLLTRHEQFDAIVLDVMLPGKNGFKVAAELREAKNFVPILMLTARGRAEDVLEGFASGADDYIAKPFELPILLARLQGLLRRTEWMRQPAQERVSDELGARGDEDELDVFGARLALGDVLMRAGQCRQGRRTDVRAMSVAEKQKRPFAL